MTILRRRMIDDLAVRNYAAATVEIYVRCVAQLAQHFTTSPDLLGPEQIRDYLIFSDWIPENALFLMISASFNYYNADEHEEDTEWPD